MAVFKYRRSSDGELATLPTGGQLIQEEGVDLTVRPKLNFVGAGVTATDDAANDATLVTIPGGGGGGTTILNGSGPPNAALGDVGDYYLDETADILYGPKNDGLPTYGPNQTLYTSESPTTSAFGSGRTVASQFTFAAKGKITALKWSRPSANSFTTHTFKVWKASDQSLLATVSSSGETGTQVLTLPLSTPVAVTAGMVLRIGIDLTDGQTLHLYPESSVAAGGIINGDITMAKTPYDVQPYGSYPNNAFSNHVFVEPVFQKETSPGNEWPVAIEGGGGGGGGAMTYSIAPPSNPSTGDVWIEKSA